MDQPWNELERHFLELMRQRKFLEAVDLLKAAHADALRAGDFQATASISNLLISSLIASGRHEEALAVLRQAQKERPSDVFISLQIASLLLGSLKRPLDALEVLEPFSDQLLGMDETRHATLGVLGACYIAAERMDDARMCFSEMLQPELLVRMDPSAFDFFLVEVLVSHGEMPQECLYYLRIVAEQAASKGEDFVRQRAQTIIRQLPQ